MVAASGSKRRWASSGASARGKRAPRLRKNDVVVAEAEEDATKIMRRVVHQFGLVGGEYDTKEARLQQLLDRLPSNAGATLVLVSSSSSADVQAAISAARRRARDAAARESRERLRAVEGMEQGVELDEEHLVQWTCGRCTLQNDGLQDACRTCGWRRGAFPDVTVATVDRVASRAVPWQPESCQLVINYDVPRSGADYLRRLGALHAAPPARLARSAPPLVAYTFVEEKELKLAAMREVVVLLRSTRLYVSDDKAAELDSALELITEDTGEGEEDDDDDEGEDEDEDEEYDCPFVGIVGSVSVHHLLPVPGTKTKPSAKVQVVRLPLRELEDFDQAVPYIAPPLPGHSLTLICLHCLNVHTPWDGWEQYFAPPGFEGMLRVVLVLADGLSWHEYPDWALLGCGGSSWVDILDMASMDRTDMLLERLVDHEAALLNGHSERIVLMGMSQGGGQSMLRFLRSRLPLGGWVGSVCHVPTGPHTPRSCDPLTVSGRPTVNLNAPVRLLAGECDTVFPPGLVQRDAARLRNVGGFTNVEVEVRKRLAHSGWVEESAPKAAKTPSPKRKQPPPPKRARLARAASKLELEEMEAFRRAQSRARRAEQSVPDLMFLQRHLPDMVGLAAGPEDLQPARPAVTLAAALATADSAKGGAAEEIGDKPVPLARHGSIDVETCRNYGA